MALYSIKPEEAKLHVSQGNSKIGKGTWSFSTLPGNDKHLLYIDDGRVLLTDVPGTCSKYCDSCFGSGCYAVNSAKLHHNAVVRARAENTLLLRSGKLFTELDAFISAKNKNPDKPKITIFRINVSGEIQDCTELINRNDLATKHPNVRFGVYTKNFDALEAFCQTIGTDKIADNFVINVSEWCGVAKPFTDRYPGVFNIFEYNPTNRKDCTRDPEEVERINKLPKCPAVQKNGHHAKTATGEPITCDMCQRCYRKTGQTTTVWSH